MPQQVSQQQDGGKHKKRGAKKGGSDALTGLGTAALLFGARQAYENFLASPTSGRRSARSARSARSPSPRRRSGRRTVGGMANIEDVSQDQVQKSMTENFATANTAANSMNNLMNTMAPSSTERFATGGMMSIQDNNVQTGGRKSKSKGKKHGGSAEEQKQQGGKKGRKPAAKRGKGKKRGGGDTNGSPVEAPDAESPQTTVVSPENTTYVPEPEYTEEFSSEELEKQEELGQSGQQEEPVGGGKRKGRKAKKGGSQEVKQDGGKKGKGKKRGSKITYGGALQMYSNQLSQLAEQINKMINDQNQQSK